MEERSAGLGTTPTNEEDRAEPGEGRSLDVRWLGNVAYAEALELQVDLVGRRRRGGIPDTLLLLEHPHVITLGSSTKLEHVLADEDERERLGIELFESGRGGDVTYHGPGQLVGYPILDLKPDRRDLHRYLRELEAALVLALADLGLDAHTREGLTGVWVEGGKIAAIGVRVSSGWITSHGFALNVAPDLDYFGAIVPCGLADESVTSIQAELERGGDAVPIDPATVRSGVVRAFTRTFGYEMLPGQHLAEDASFG